MADTRLQQLAKSERNPIEETEYQNLLRQSGVPFSLQNGKANVSGFGVGGNGADSSLLSPQVTQSGYFNPPPDPIAEARKLRDFNIESNQPVIQNLEASKAPLKDRYTNLINELKRRETVDTDQNNLALSREYGKRGIPLSSGMFDQDLIQKQRPTREFYASQLAGANTGLDEGLLGVDKIIAQLKTGDPASSVQSAISLQSLSQQAKQNAIETALGLRRFEEVDKPLAQAQAEAYRNQNAKPSTSLDDLAKVFGL